MRSQGLLVVVSLLVLAVAWFALGGNSAPVDAPPGRSSIGDQQPAAQARDAATGLAVPAVADPLAEAAVRTPVLPGAGAAAAVPACSVRGRLVDRGGAARAAVEVFWASTQDRDLGGIPLAFRPDQAAARESVRTDRDGRFAFTVARSHRGQLTLDTERLVFRRGEVEFSTAQGDQDLGDLVAVAPGHLRGVVEDERGQPVADVKISAAIGDGLGLGGRADTKTGADGRFDIGALHAGKWTLRTLSARHLPAVLTVDLVDEEQKDGVRLVVGQGQRIAGQVVDDRGLPIAGAQVGAMRKERTLGVSIERFTPDEATTTDAGGFFELGGLTGETVTVRASSKGHSPASEANVAIGTGNVLLRLSRRASIAGVLRDTAGVPLAGSRVVARAERRGVVAHPGAVAADDLEFEPELESVRPANAVETAADGTFLLDDVESGAIIVRALGKTHRPVQSSSLTVQPAQSMTGVVLIAERGATLQATVVDEQGEPVADAKVAVREPDEPAPSDGNMVRRSVRIGGDGGEAVMIGSGPKRLGSGTTNAQGVAEVAGLPAAAAIVACTHEQLADAQPTLVVLPAQGRAEVRLVLRRPGIAALSTSLPSGAAVAASYVVHGPTGVGEDERDQSGKTDADGRARLERMAAGDYWAELRVPPKPRSFGGAMMVIGGDQAVVGTRVPFRIEPGRSTAVDLRMPILTRVHGVVTGADGPAADVVIELVAEAGADAPGEHGPALPDETSARSGADGGYELPDVMPGRYRLRWGKPDQVVKASATIEIAANQAELQRDLELRYGKLRVVVVGKDDGEPIEGAEVELAEAGNAPAGAPPRRERRMMMISMTTDGSGGSETTSMTMGSTRATTDVDGIAEVVDVPPGRYRVRLRHDRHVEREIKDQEVLERATTDCGRVELDAAGRIRGRALTADGKPASMVMARCRKVGDAGAGDRQPAMNGSFTFPGLAPGRYAVSAQRLGGAEGAPFGEPVEVEVGAGKTASGIEVRLPAD